MDKLNMLGEREALLEKIRSLEAQNEELRAMLRKHEWNGHPQIDMCPDCGGFKGMGHSPDCALARSIK